LFDPELIPSDGLPDSNFFFLAASIHATALGYSARYVNKQRLEPVAKLGWTFLPPAPPACRHPAASTRARFINCVEEVRQGSFKLPSIENCLQVLHRHSHTAISPQTSASVLSGGVV
jgi:hypothetical protein